MVWQNRSLNISLNQYIICHYFFLYCSSESGTNDNHVDEDYEEPSNSYSDDDRPSDDDLYIK